MRKKTEVFTREEIDAFLSSGPERENEDDLTMKKCALAIALYGLLQVLDLTSLRYEDIKEESSGDC